MKMRVSIFARTCIVFCLLALTAGLSGAEDFALRRKDNDIQVSCAGGIYTILKNVQPKWGACSPLKIGDSDVNSLTIQVVTQTPMPESTKTPVSLLPNGSQSSLTVLSDTAELKHIRAEYALSPVDQLKLIHPGGKLVVDFRFIAGIPGVAVDARVIGVSDNFIIRGLTGQFGREFESYRPEGKEVVLYDTNDWKPIKVGSKTARFVLAEKKGKSMLIAPVSIKTPNKGFVAIGTPNEYKPIRLGEGESIGLKLLFGFAGTEEDAEKLLAFREMLPDVTLAAPEVPVMGMKSVTALKPLAIGSFQWGDIPLLVERNKITDYRPVEANTWRGPQTLSFQTWSAFDTENLYLRIKVLDDEVVQTATGSSIWSGDCIQIAFDPLCEERLSGNLILIGVAPTQPVTVCAWSHPDKNLVRDDISDVVKTASRIVPGGYECEMAIPWSFLNPFELKHGKIGFNVVVLDGGKHWMGITDGIAGGKDPGLYQKLYFSGMEQALFANQREPAPELLFPDSILIADEELSLGAFVFLAADDLPAELEVNLNGKALKRQALKAGFNSFQWKIPRKELTPGNQTASVYLLRDGEQRYTRTYPVTLITRSFLLESTDKLEKENQKLSRKIDEIRKSSGEPSYLVSRTAVTHFFLNKTRMICREKGDAAEKRYKQTAIRAYRNLAFLNQVTEDGLKQADAILAGKEKFFTVQPPPKGVRPVIADGGFKLNGQEIFFIGANTWMLRNRGMEEDLEDMATAGLNFFNLVNVHDAARRRELIELADRLGLFYNRRETGNHIRKNYLYYSGESVAARAAWPEIERNDPSLVYLVAHEETASFPPVIDNDLTGITLVEHRMATLQDHLRKKYGSPEAMNKAMGTSCKSFEEINEKAVQASIALKFEQFRCMTALQAPALRNYNQALRKFSGLPVSTHFSELNFRPYDTLEIGGDYDQHWAPYDIPGFDAGTGFVHKQYAMNFSGRSILLTDLARSLYPDRPCANNEEYIVSIGNTTVIPPPEYHYAGAILPALHGRNATSIFVMDHSWTSSWGELTFRRADAVYMTAKAALDLRRLAPEIATFRSAKSPAAILYTMPSYARKDYPDWLITAFEGCYFSGFPVRFVSDRLVLDGKLQDYQILVVPNAQYATDEVFAKIAAFAGKGGKVLCLGRESLSMNEYGQKIAQREAVRKNFIFLERDTPEGCFAQYGKLLKQLNQKPLVEVETASGDGTFGLEYRSAKTPDGKTLLYLLNLRKTPLTVKIPGDRTWIDLIDGKPFSAQTTIAPLELHLLQQQD